MSYTNRGNAYFRRGEYDRAIQDYDRALELNPHLGLPYTNRGVAYASKGDFDQRHSGSMRPSNTIVDLVICNPPILPVGAAFTEGKSKPSPA